MAHAISTLRGVTACNGDSAFYSSSTSPRCAAFPRAASFGFGPRGSGRRRRPRRASSEARKSSEPAGLPTLSPLRSRSTASGSSGPSSRSAKRAKRWRAGVVSVSGSSPRPSRARALDHGQSCARDKFCAHGVLDDVTIGGGEMVLVHRHRAEPPLPEMPGAALARMDSARVSAMDARQDPAQPVFVLGAQDQMNVVGHQRPSPDRDLGFARRAAEEVAIGGVIRIRIERPPPPVAALGDVVRRVGNNDASKAGHEGALAEIDARSNRMPCHRNPKRLNATAPFLDSTAIRTEDFRLQTAEQARRT